MKKLVINFQNGNWCQLLNPKAFLYWCRELNLLAKSPNPCREDITLSVVVVVVSLSNIPSKSIKRVCFLFLVFSGTTTVSFFFFRIYS